MLYIILLLLFIIISIIISIIIIYFINIVNYYHYYYYYCCCCCCHCCCRELYFYLLLFCLLAVSVCLFLFLFFKHSYIQTQRLREELNRKYAAKLPTSTNSESQQLPVVSDLERQIEQEIVDLEVDEFNAALCARVETDEELQKLSPGFGTSLVHRAKCAMMVSELKAQSEKWVRQFRTDTRTRLQRDHTILALPDFNSCFSYDWLAEKVDEATDEFSQQENNRLNKAIEEGLRAYPHPQGFGQAVAVAAANGFVQTEEQRKDEYLQKIPEVYQGTTYTEQRKVWRR